MKKVRFFVIMLLVSITTFTQAQVLFEESFIGAQDTLRGYNGWVAQTTGASTNAIRIISTPLTYTGYAISGLGQSVRIDTVGQDLYHSFTAQSTGSVYTSFMLKVIKATTSGDYFFSYIKGTSGTTYYARLYAKKATDTTFYLGICKYTETVDYTINAYPLDTTLLCVVKYDILAGDSNDITSVYVNPSMSVEPTADLIHNGNTKADVGTNGIGAIQLRQGSASSAPKCLLGGIRVATSWGDLFAVDTIAPTYTAVAVNDTTIQVIYSKEVDSTALISTNYTLNNNATISSVAKVDDTTYTLTCSALIAETTYNLTINGVKDLLGNTMNNVVVSVVYHAGDIVAPTVTSLQAMSKTNIRVIFSEKVETTTAQDTANYVISGLSVVSATLQNDTIVDLTVSAMTTNTYAITISNIKDTANNVMATYTDSLSYVDTVICANIADLLSQTVGTNTIFVLSNYATVTFKQASNNQKYIQDTTGAIMIHDPQAILSNAIQIGNAIKNVTGKLSTYKGSLQLVPIVNIDTVNDIQAVGETIVPQTLTLAQLADATFIAGYQSQLVTLENIWFPAGDGNITFATNKYYSIADSLMGDTALFYTGFYQADYISTIIPYATIVGNITGIVTCNNNKHYITARSMADLDFEMPTPAPSYVIAGWTFDVADTSIIYNSNVLFDANAGLEASTATLYLNGQYTSSNFAHTVSDTMLKIFSGSTLNDPRDTALASYALAILGNTNDSSIVFKFTTKGYQDAVLSYIVRATATGAGTHHFSVSTDGVTYCTPVTKTISTIGSFYKDSIALNDILATGTDNMDIVYVKWTFNGASNAGGNNRLDNIVIRADEYGTVATPEVKSVTATSLTNVDVAFNNAMDATTAEDIANYSINNNVTISAASLSSDLKTVSLTVSALTEGITYILTVAGDIEDTAGVAIGVASMHSFMFGFPMERTAKTLAELRNFAADNTTEYLYTGRATVTYTQSNRNQKFIQDSTAAIVIDDNNGVIVSSMLQGDAVTNLKGKLTSYYGLLQFVPTENPTDIDPDGDNITPIIITLSDLDDTTLMFAKQCMLAQVQGVTFASADGSAKFVVNTQYTLNDGSMDREAMRTHFYDANYIGDVIPSTKEDITGIIIYSYNVNYIVPRSRIDMKESVGIEEVDSEELSIYPNPVRDILNINAEVSKVEIFAVNGQQLLTSQSNSINISNLPAGMYFVRAQLLNGKVAISKFVKR